MQDTATIAFFLGVIAYSVAATLFFLELARREPGVRGAQWAPRVLAIGAVAHAAHIVTASLLSRVCPVESLHFGLSLSALIAVTVYLLVRKRLRMNAIGAFIAPVALTFLIGAQFVGEASAAAASLPRGLLALHIAANVSGVGLFLIAGAAGAFYLVQERRLRKKHVKSGGSRLPALDLLERTEHRLLLAGFPLLTFGVVTGALFVHRLGENGNADFFRTLLGYATWLLLAGVLFLRQAAGVRGRRATYGTLAGVVCMLLVMLLYAVRLGGGSS
ncbi:MAG TPA: cytochrome c biogenesis protein CcsA [Polyangiaceae bacterium]